MAAISSSQTATEKSRIPAAQLNARLKNCWLTDIDWEKYPKTLKEVNCTVFHALESLCCFGMLVWQCGDVGKLFTTYRDAARLERQFANQPLQFSMA